MASNHSANTETRPILVTGGAGFIGSNFVLDWCRTERRPVITLDKLTYAGNRYNLTALDGNAQHRFVQGDIADTNLVRSILSSIRPRAVINFAAESHVDRSILSPDDFISTNIVGTYRLLECAREHWSKLPSNEKEEFRFLHVSTDEVYGSLTPSATRFDETSPYAPNSPYAASKAASDHLARAWHHTYGLPVLTTHCSNNYGPYQFPEKLIPLMIHHAMEGRPLPVYGDGLHVRDWLYVGDHCSAISLVLDKGEPGCTFAIGGNSEKTNISVVQTICDILDEERPIKNGGSYRDQIAFVSDRPGHDRRYAINTAKIHETLGWQPRENIRIRPPQNCSMVSRKYILSRRGGFRRLS